MEKTEVITKAKMTRGYPRLWCEHKALINHDWARNTRYDRTFINNAYVLRKNESGKFKVSGKGTDKAIIDITGKHVDSSFNPENNKLNKWIISNDTIIIQATN
jgi:hypothetical protein